jgi:hypothetical protein
VASARSIRFVGILAAFLLLAAPGGSLRAQDDAPAPEPPAEPAPKKPEPAPPAQVPQKDIDEAVKRGVDFLLKKTEESKYFHGSEEHYKKQVEELVLFTLFHAGEEVIKRTDPVVKRLFAKIKSRKLTHTYNVSLLAMCMRELDARKYRPGLMMCGQFLADAQCQNGQWTYTANRTRPNNASPSWNRSLRPVATGKEKAPKPVGIAKKFIGAEQGDNSNSQYAALGIRACWEGGVLFPDEVLVKAKEHWEKAQGSIGGWSYVGGDPSYGSMTHGAVASLSIYCTMMGEDPKKNETLKKGVEWITNNFWVDRVANYGRIKWVGQTKLYCLYGLERAGMLYGVDFFGKRAWYNEGAAHLLRIQKEDGSWHEEMGGDVVGTCFAILFLKKATRPVASVPR